MRQKEIGSRNVCWSLRLAAFFIGAVVALPAHAVFMVHDFYLPMPENQVRTSLFALQTQTGTTLDSVFSVVVTGDGTVIHYDHWEDGYEVDINNPAQPSTRIWGDGNNANGIAPGFANDPAGLPAGTVLSLRNLVPLPRNPSTILYDARDRVTASKAIVVSRAAWATTPGSVLAGAVEVNATIDYGTSFISPVGQDVAAASMFEYVALFVMAGENNTAVTIDTDGAGPAAPFVVTLNRAESYHVNGGILKGATVTATKPVQAHLITGDIGANYESRWFTLVPVEQWYSSYLTPVGTAADGDPCYVFAYNPGASAITVNYTTRVGTGSFPVGANAVVQWQVPQNSGARLTNTNGLPFFALSVVGANPSANNVHDWGFTLVPEDGLTTEAVVGWGPGSSDLTQNGSPVWVAPAAATRIYVDFNGDRAGPNTDPNGNKYDVHYDLAALQSQTIYDPDKDQTAMRLYTLDGTFFATAWGQDPAVAAPGNPYLDLGTTVLPFPVPVIRKSSVIVQDNGDPGLTIGDILEYRIEVDNKGLLPLGNTLIVDALPPAIEYQSDTTTYNGNPVADDGVGATIFPLDETGYTIPIILRGGTSVFTYRVEILASGSIRNTATGPGYSLVVDHDVEVPPPAGATQCVLDFTDDGGAPTTVYQVGADIYVWLDDIDANVNTLAVDTVTMTAENLDNGDLETLLLTETGADTGLFFSLAPLPSSASAGLATEDGILYATAGSTLSVTYIDPLYGDSCSASASMAVASETKVLYLTTDGADNDDTGALDRRDPVATGDSTTSTSGVLIATSTTNSFTTAGTQTWTVPAGVTSITVECRGGGGAGGGSTSAGFLQGRGGAGGGGGAYASSILSVTPGQALTIVVPGTAAGVSGATGNSGSPAFVGPDSDPANASVRAAGGSGGTGNTSGGTPAGGAGGTVANSVGTTRVAGTTGGAGATGFLISSGAGGGGAQGGGDGGAAVTSGSANGNAGTAPGGAGGGSRTSGDAGNRTGGSGTVGRVVISYAASPSATFTQTPVLCSDLSLPAGGVVTITNYIAVTSGTMPNPANVTAQLKYGATTFFSDSSAVYSSAGGVTTLTWSATVSAATTIPDGEAITLVVSNAQSGVSFVIEYDSQTRPSKIGLPTTTVIAIDSLAVYDAPYPGGSPVVSVAAGATVYVRATVSDPFGAYDITGLDLAIPGAGVNVSLDDTAVVASDSCSKTYEYAWPTAAEGDFEISVIAHEGTEGITDTAATSLNVTFLDLGTPSITEFTIGNDGLHTEQYETNQTVCVRVTDLDQNINTGAAETVTAVITTSSGDTETIVLTETGPDTGIFTACIPASATVDGGDEDGTLYAPPGTGLTVSYTDPTDPTDQSGDTAIVPLPTGTPGISVTKTLIDPADGQAMIGETVRFGISVANVGSLALPNVSLTDTYPSANLSYQSATLAPDSAGGGTIVWNEIGPLAVGQSTSFSVEFTAVASSASATNSVTADAGGGVSATDDATVIITQPSHQVIKTLLSPDPGPANYGDLVTFRIVVTNTGDTAIETLPLEDTYSMAFFQYDSATLDPDAVGAGSLLWFDLTGASSLAPGATLSVDVTLKAVGAGNPANNTASADYSVDEYGDPVPPASSTTGVVTLAASITGTVWDDANINATNDLGEVGIGGVTLYLYTDPNGDGDPSDGVLVQVTATTSTNGFYEFVNLGTGTYVVVQADLPGYASSGDTYGTNDNRIAIHAAGSGVYPGNDFFDYLIPLVEYASIAGTVWNDVNGNGTNDLGESGLEGFTVQLIADANGNGVADLGESVIAVTTTDANGGYLFGGVAAGDYVVREIDSPGYNSTGDTDSANDNQIGVTVVAGDTSTGNDFFDTIDIPTLAVLLSFGAESRDGTVYVTWETAVEFGTIGFIVERLADESDEYVRIHDEVIPGSLFSAGPKAYEIPDADAAAGGTYTYRLIEIENTGLRNIYGPFTVTVDGERADMLAWLERWFGDLSLSNLLAVAAADPDGDGMSNAEEFLARTDPTDILSALKLVWAEMGLDGLTLEWSSSTGCLYDVEFSTNLAEGFEAILNGIPATPPRNQLTVPSVDGKPVFYRIRLAP